MKSRRSKWKTILKQAGFSYVEVLIATVLIAVSLVPALDALQAGLKGSEVQAEYIEGHFYLTGKMETVLAEPFSVLAAAATPEGNPVNPSTYSDSLTTPQGRTITRQVFLRPYDGDNADADNDPFTGTDPGLLWVQVAIDGTAYAIESLTGQ